MRRARLILSMSCLLCSGVAMGNAANVVPHTGDDTGAVVVAAESELDYLKASQLPVSIDMKQVSARRIFDTVAEAAGVRVAYEGQFSDKAFDVSYSKLPLKDLLTKLGTTLGVSYRVENRTSLIVIGEPAK